jgi:perosamine synthetase
MKRIFYTKPSISELEVELAQDAARNGWGASCYDYIHKFEQEFAAYVGCKYAIATSSCTGALEMGMAALGIGRSDQVILADTNWIATVAPVMHLGASPIYVDILKDTWCIDPQEVATKITKSTKAIIATHIYGNLCDMNQLNDIAKSHGIALIEDSAEAVGAIYQGRHVGSIGTFGAFSFHGTKTITTGEGGMFVTNDESLFDKVTTLSNHGRSATQQKQFWADVIGYKFKMSNIQAAIGLGQLRRIDEITRRKQDILRAYKNQLLVRPGLSMNSEPEDCTNGAWMPTVVFEESLGITREILIDAFKDAKIDARVFFYPLSTQPMFAPAQTPNSHSICRRAINLPSYHDLTDKDIDRVCSVIISLLEAKK